MYAAAGGASLASRQARQKQRQNKQKQMKINKATELATKPQQAKHFQNYTDSAIPKLSRVERGTLRPRVEMGTLRPPAPHDRRHSASQCHLKEPPHRARLRESPSISIPVRSFPHPPPQDGSAHSLQAPRLPQIFMPEEGNLERRCSFVRQVEEMERGGTVEHDDHIRNFDIEEGKWDDRNFHAEYDRDIFGSLEYPFSECSQGRAAWQERERGRRCSLSEEARQHRQKQTEAHHRWMKRNRIHDASYGGGSDDEDFFSVYHQSAAANALLYVGLGTTAIGSIIFFVGTGEKGFKTLELRLIGPTLIACGLLCCLIRVLLCAVPSTCLRRRKRTRLKSNACPHSSGFPLAPKYRHTRDLDFVDQTTLLTKSKKKVSIVPPNHSLPSTSTTEFKEPPQLQLPTEMSIPEIQLPSSCGEEGGQLSREDSIFELQALDLGYDVQSVSSNDSDGVTVIDVEKPGSKLTKLREPLNSRADDVETCLSVVIERKDASESGECGENKLKEANSNAHAHSGIVLSPSQLGQ